MRYKCPVAVLGGVYLKATLDQHRNNMTMDDFYSYTKVGLVNHTASSHLHSQQETAYCIVSKQLHKETEKAIVQFNSWVATDFIFGCKM